jgi:hypothetical protein
MDGVPKGRFDLRMGEPNFKPHGRPLGMDPPSRIELDLSDPADFDEFVKVMLTWTRRKAG